MEGQTITEALEQAGYRVEPRRSQPLTIAGQRAIVRISDGEWMGDFYALDAFNTFITKGPADNEPR